MRFFFFVRAHSATVELTALTCIVPYFLDSVKGIVDIFYLVAVAVRQRLELAVVRVVGVRSQPKRDGRSRPLEVIHLIVTFLEQRTVPCAIFTFYTQVFTLTVPCAMCHILSNKEQ